MITVIEDTAQKAGKHDEKHEQFERAGIRLIRCKLPFGDYILPPAVSVDTKKGLSEVAYDIVNDLGGVLDEFDNVVGIARLKAVHANDSMNVRGSHKDRHEKIGKGKIGIDAFAHIVNEPRLRELPFYLETPCDLQGYKEEIALLKSLAQGD